MYLTDNSIQLSQAAEQAMIKAGINSTPDIDTKLVEETIKILMDNQGIEQYSGKLLRVPASVQLHTTGVPGSGKSSLVRSLQAALVFGDEQSKPIRIDRHEVFVALEQSVKNLNHPIHLDYHIHGMIYSDYIMSSLYLQGQHWIGHGCNFGIHERQYLRALAQEYSKTTYFVAVAGLDIDTVYTRLNTRATKEESGDDWDTPIMESPEFFAHLDFQPDVIAGKMFVDDQKSEYYRLVQQGAVASKEGMVTIETATLGSFYWWQQHMFKQRWDSPHESEPNIIWIDGSQPQNAMLEEALGKIENMQIQKS